MEILNQLYRDTSGAALVEYALLLTFIAIAALGGMSALGISISSSLGNAAGAFN
jgi:Flp pilus assembly pilin Flp